MEIRYFSSAESFLEFCESCLTAQEDLYHTIITLAQLVASRSNVLSPPYIFGCALERNSVVGCFLHVKPDGLCLTEFPRSAARQVVESLGSSVTEIQRISGPPTVADALIDELLDRQGPVEVRNEARWNIYRADIIEATTTVQGELRLATDKDFELITQWGEIYQAESPSPVDVPKYLVRKCKEKRLYLWEDGRPRSLIATSAPTECGINLTAAFTPPDDRGKGYGSAGVAAVCRVSLDEGLDFVVLSAKKDSSPERIYRKLGFYKIGERDCHTLVWQKT